MEDRALQELIPHNNCFGCGPENESGLQLKSYWSGVGISRAIFLPKPWHCAGPKHFVNGGIISTIIDCHCICTATAAAYFNENRKIGSSPLLCFATSKLNLHYRRPISIDTKLQMEAIIKGATKKHFIITCDLTTDDGLCVQGEVEAVRVSSSWMGI